ncbi:unnamed protein product [Malus baccata var. baccata]
MFHSLPLSLVPCLFSSSVTLTQRSRASSLSRSVILVPCLFSSSVTLTHGGATLFPYPSPLYSGPSLLPSQLRRSSASSFSFTSTCKLRYGLMCCRQCFRSNAKEIGFIKITPFPQCNWVSFFELFVCSTVKWLIFKHSRIFAPPSDGKLYNQKDDGLPIDIKLPVKHILMGLSYEKKKKKKTKTEPKKSNRKKNRKKFGPNRNFGLVSVLAKNRTD